MKKAPSLTVKPRRGKTALFLIVCGWAGAMPHFLTPSRSLLPALTLALLLGSYGLRIVLRSKKKWNFNSQIKVFDDQFLPKVDILVAARDEEAVLGRLIEQLHQIVYPKEKLNIWIIDDGSEDKTSEVLDDLKLRFPFFKVLRRSRQAGGGKSGALNEALKVLKGEWIFVLDADAQVQNDVLQRLMPVAQEGNWSALQLRKAVTNSLENFLTRCQAMEMAMDALIQKGRLLGGGVVELRGNGQLLNRRAIEKCGGFNEDTVTDDLDLSFRLLVAGESIGILWDPPVQEEAVESFYALWKQRQRWAEGGLQRFFDYWPSLTSPKLNWLKKQDLTSFFLLQYALPVISCADLFTSLVTKSFPTYWPLSLIAFSVSGLAYWRGCKTLSEGPFLPSPNIINLFGAILYLIHWFIVIPFATVKMAILPKTLSWSKTKHIGN